MDCVQDSTESRRLSTKSYLLTYSQSRLAKHTIFDFLTSGFPVAKLIVGEEKHADGNPHFHAYVVYAKQREVTFHAFDLGGEHPNIKTHKKGMNPEQSHWNCWQYVSKEDSEPMVSGSPPIQPPPRESPRKRQRDDEGTTLTPKKSKRDHLVERCFDMAKDPEQSASDAYDELMRCSPAYAVERRNAYVQAFQLARTKALCPPATPRSLSSFTNLPILLPNWRCLFITGPTLCGKTAWARALLPQATVVSHKDQLKDADMSKGIIFDDFDTCHWPANAVIHLLDWDEERGLDVKHGHVIIPSKTRKIFTHNKTFEEWLKATDEKYERTAAQQAACRRRVQVLAVHKKLYTRATGVETLAPIEDESQEAEETEDEGFGFSVPANQYQDDSE